MYAIIKNGGKQYKVTEGDEVILEKFDSEVGSVIEHGDVLLVENDGKLQIGQPIVEGAKVTLEVVEHGKGDKVIIFKMKAKKGYRKKQGHRQPYTKVLVKSIVL